MNVGQIYQGFPGLARTDYHPILFAAHNSLTLRPSRRVASRRDCDNSKLAVTPRLPYKRAFLASGLA
jgi:hypothetical protein